MHFNPGEAALYKARMTASDYFFRLRNKSIPILSDAFRAAAENFTSSSRRTKANLTFSTLSPLRSQTILQSPRMFGKLRQSHFRFMVVPIRSWPIRPSILGKPQKPFSS